MSKIRQASGAESDLLGRPVMMKEDLVKLINRVLGTDADLDFLLRLDKGELTTLLVSIRDKLIKGEGG
jgi:hypothetical protein